MRLDTFSPIKPEWEVQGVEGEQEMKEEEHMKEIKNNEFYVSESQQNSTDEDINFGERNMSCKKCGKTFKHKKSLKKHNLRIPLCDSSYQTKTEGSLIKIPDISKKIVNKFNFKVEVKPIKSNKCEVCNHDFSSSDKLQIHVEEYYSKYECCMCNKLLGNRHKLRNHHRTHTREKPFECRLCEKIFSECSSLRKHILTHNMKTFRCNNCGKSFARNDYLLKHLKSNVCFNQKKDHYN